MFVKPKQTWIRCSFLNLKIIKQYQNAKISSMIIENYTKNSVKEQKY